MARSITSLLAAAGCLAAGCTAIVYGDDLSQGSGVASGGAAASQGGTTQPPDPSGGDASSAGGRTANAPGAAGFDSESALGGGGGEMADVGGAAGAEAGGAGASGAGAAGEPATAAGGVGTGGEAGAAGSPAGGQGGAPEESGAAGAPPLLPGDAARGYKLVVLNNCYRCHGSDLAGSGFYRNITPDAATGIGTWSDAQIARGIAGGTNAQGVLLCASMPIYSGLGTQGMADMIAFLRSIPARYNPITSVCPGHAP